MKQIANTQTYVAIGMFIPAGAGDIYHEVIVIDTQRRMTKTLQYKFTNETIANHVADEILRTATPFDNLDPAVFIPTYWKKEFEGVA